MNHKRWRFRCLVLIPLMMAPVAAQGGTYLNTFEPVANLSPDGKTMTVTVKLGCDAGDRYRLRVTVSQRGVGAVAEGSKSGRCRGVRFRETSQSIPVTARVIGDVGFERGRNATPAGLVVTSDKRGGSLHRMDVHQWVPTSGLSIQ